MESERLEWISKFLGEGKVSRKKKPRVKMSSCSCRIQHSMLASKQRDADYVENVMKRYIEEKLQ